MDTHLTPLTINFGNSAKDSSKNWFNLFFSMFNFNVQFQFPYRSPKRKPKWQDLFRTRSSHRVFQRAHNGEYSFFVVTLPEFRNPKCPGNRSIFSAREVLEPI